MKDKGGPLKCLLTVLSLVAVTSLLLVSCSAGQATVPPPGTATVSATPTQPAATPTPAPATPTQPATTSTPAPATPTQPAATPTPATPTEPVPSPTASSATAAVTIKGFAFDPASITVKVGTSVTWTNEDGAPHTITSDKGDWDSGRIAQGGTYTRTFDQAGTYAYHCAVHPSMTGTVVVTP